MSKIIKKTVITIMTVSMMFTSMFNTVFADATDSYIKQQPENTEGLPDYTDGFEKHGFADEDAEEIDSMFTAADWERFNEEADEALEFKPVSDTEASAVLTKVEDFLKNNGVGNYLQNGNLLQGANIGLTQNRTDKVKILGTDANAGGDYIYVIDKDATCFAIKDENGKGIANALVTISYIDDNNNRKTVSTIASDGDVPGVAVFSDLPESFNGILDVQAENYQAVSILDKYLEAGENYVFALKEAQKDSLYLRGADICGKDLLNEETDLFVVDRDTEDLTLKVLVSKTGSAGLPNTIDLYSETRGKTILTLNKMSDYEYDSNTVVYAATKRWLEQSAGLLEGGDVVSVRFNDNSHILEHLTIKKALETPRVGETTMPVTSSPMSAPITDRLGGAGWLNFSVQVLQVPVTFGVFPDGTFIIMASYDITSLDQNTQYKFNSLFDKSWKPKAFENAKNIFESFERSFWENAQKVHSGKTKLNSKDKIRMFNSRSYDISMSFSVYFKLCYNKDADDYYGNGGFVFSLGFSGGITEYFVFFAGPVAIPLYIGFDLSFGIKIGISVNLFTETPPAGQEYDHKYKYTSNDGWDLNLRIEAIGNLNVFGGIGVKGVLGANATGYFTVDVATVLGEGPASIFTAEPHSFVDLLYGMIINYYLLFFSGQIKFDCLQGAKRVYDSYGEQDLQLENLSIEFKELSLESCADELIPVNDISDTDPAYTIANNQNNLTGAGISNVDSYTYPDNQAQFVSTKDFTALFRIVADGEQTHLVYQYQDPSTGDIADTVFQVQLPADKSVSEYVVVPNKSDTNDTRYCNYAYIGAVLVDNTLEDMNERAKSSEVAAIVVDLKSAKTISSEIASNPADNGAYLYSAPRPAGIRDFCDVQYAGTTIKDCETTEQLLETITAGLKDITLTKTYNFLSYRELNDSETRKYKGIEAGKVFSTGSAKPLEPTYWVIDPIRSTNKTLVIKGYEYDGTCTEDRRHYVNIDISHLNVQDFNYEPVLSNWQYVNGNNYFIAGDTVYWMKKSVEDLLDYEWIVEPVENGKGMVSTEGRYTMITNNNQSAIYIIGVVDSYDINVEDWSETKSSNKVMLHTLITEEQGGKLTCKLHGPIGLSFAKGDKITNFTVAYNPAGCSAKGLSIIYSSPVEANRSVYSPLRKTTEEAVTPDNEDVTTENEALLPEQIEEAVEEQAEEAAVADSETRAVETRDLNSAPMLKAEEEDDGPQYGEADEAAALRLWKQNAERGMRVTEVQIPDNILRKGTPYILTNVTFRNYGYAIEGPVMFRATDEQGNVLTLSDGYRDYSDYDYYYSDVLYTGDSETVQVYIKPSDKWEANTSHEITIEVLPQYYYDGDMDEIVNKAVMKDDNISLTATNNLIGDRHYVHLTITNNTFVGTEPPKIKAIFRYSDPEKEEIRYYNLPTQEKLLMYDGDDEELTDHVYNYELDMDEVWDKGLDEGLLGIYFLLVDEEGLQKSNEIVYVLNPEEIVNDSVSGIKLDENGEPLAGATIAIYAEGSEEALQSAVSDEEGKFFFSNLPAGNYIIKETEAPEGYILDEKEYQVSCKGEGKVIEIEITNSIITGNVKVKLTDEEGKGIEGAVFGLYQGDKLIATLEEKGNGIYEVSDMPYGNYTVEAVKSPDDRKINDAFTVTIKENGETVTVNIKLTQSPDTGDNNLLGMYVAFEALSLIGIILIIRRKRQLNMQ